MKTRRKFLKDSAGVAIMCTAFGTTTFLESCVAMKFVSYSSDGEHIRIKIADYADRKFVVVNDPSLRAPVYVRRIEAGQYRAFLMLCTHKACDVKAQGAILKCFCHGSEFASDGHVLKGPAKESLKEFAVTSDDVHIIIKVKS